MAAAAWALACVRTVRTCYCGVQKPPLRPLLGLGLSAVLGAGASGAALGAMGAAGSCALEERTTSLNFFCSGAVGVAIASLAVDPEACCALPLGSSGCSLRFLESLDARGGAGGAWSACCDAGLRLADGFTLSTIFMRAAVSNFLFPFHETVAQARLDKNKTHTKMWARLLSLPENHGATSHFLLRPPSPAKPCCCGIIAGPPLIRCSSMASSGGRSRGTVGPALGSRNIGLGCCIGCMGCMGCCIGGLTAGPSSVAARSLSALGSNARGNAVSPCVETC